MIVTIDPGHSGPVEPGACAGDMHECNVTLGIALQLAALIREDGHTVYLLRESDIDDTDTDGLAWRANASRSRWMRLSSSASGASTAISGSSISGCACSALHSRL